MSSKVPAELVELAELIKPQETWQLMTAITQQLRGKVGKWERDAC